MGSICVTDLGKAYKQYPSRWARLKEWVLPGHRQRHQLHWVLQGISFKVEPGEAVGIVGMNGAGKSTLLKILTGTTSPTTGSVEILGRVAALLELGMGFHPDFTGRQNVVIAGQLLGLTREEITALLPAIESFAEIGDYLDQPVRVYSSGMQVRLAFSLATVRRPDVLIVDEALSVGDAYFQHKSFDRIRQFRNQGTTLLIVSHDKGAIQSICNRAMLLNLGRIVMEGKPEAVMDFYNAMLADHQKQHIQQTIDTTGRVQTVSGTGEATIESLAIIDKSGLSVESVGVGDAIAIKVSVRIKEMIEDLIFGYSIKDRLGQVVYGTNTSHSQQTVHDLAPGSLVSYTVRFCANLGPGTYSLQTALTSSDTHLQNNYEWRDLAMIFEVVNRDKPHFVGVAWIEPSITVEQA